MRVGSKSEIHTRLSVCSNRRVSTWFYYQFGKGFNNTINNRGNRNGSSDDRFSNLSVRIMNFVSVIVDLVLLFFWRPDLVKYTIQGIWRGRIRRWIKNDARKFRSGSQWKSLKNINWRVNINWRTEVIRLVPNQIKKSCQYGYGPVLLPKKNMKLNLRSSL